jgi:hypothetical protein
MFSSWRRPCPGRRRPFTGLVAGCGFDEMPADRCVDETLPEVVFIVTFV